MALNELVLFQPWPNPHFHRNLHLTVGSATSCCSRSTPPGYQVLSGIQKVGKLHSQLWDPAAWEPPPIFHHKWLVQLTSFRGFVKNWISHYLFDGYAWHIPSDEEVLVADDFANQPSTMSHQHWVATIFPVGITIFKTTSQPLLSLHISNGCWLWLSIHPKPQRNPSYTNTNLYNALFIYVY